MLLDGKIRGLGTIWMLAVAACVSVLVTIRSVPASCPLKNKADGVSYAESKPQVGKPDPHLHEG